MDTILDMTKTILSSVCFRLLTTDVAWDNIFFFCLCREITLAYLFCQDGTVHRHNGCNFFMIQCNGQFSTACVWTFPEDKIEEWVNFALSHSRLYLAGSNDE